MSRPQTARSRTQQQYSVTAKGMKLEKTRSDPSFESKLEKRLQLSYQERSRTSTERTIPSQVIIHVFDETRNVKRDFYCDRQLLINKMKYFQPILQDTKTTEIDVHSDIQVFERLMGYCIHNEIHLNSTNIVSILISSHFLQMNDLETNCIEYMKDTIDDVLLTPIDFGCINGVLAERFGKMFGYEELFHLKDPKDKLKSKLYLYQLDELLSPVDGICPIQQCKDCKQLYTILHSKEVLEECPNAIPLLTVHGHLERNHTRDPTFDINDWITTQISFQTIESIFWKLWSYKHTFTCTRCGKLVSFGNMNTCFRCEKDCAKCRSSFSIFREYKGCYSTQHIPGSDQYSFKEILDTLRVFENDFDSLKLGMDIPVDFKSLFGAKKESRKPRVYQHKQYLQRDQDVEQMQEWIAELTL